jgi:hypothetical protein
LFCVAFCLSSVLRAVLLHDVAVAKQRARGDRGEGGGGQRERQGGREHRKEAEIVQGITNDRFGGQPGIFPGVDDITK